MDHESFSTSPTDINISELHEEALMALGSAALYDNDTSLALECYSQVETPHAAWNQSQIYLLLADQVGMDSPHSASERISNLHMASQALSLALKGLSRRTTLDDTKLKVKLLAQQDKLAQLLGEAEKSPVTCALNYDEVSPIPHHSSTPMKVTYEESLLKSKESPMSKVGIASLNDSLRSALKQKDDEIETMSRQIQMLQAEMEEIKKQPLFGGVSGYSLAVTSNQTKVEEVSTVNTLTPFSSNVFPSLHPVKHQSFPLSSSSFALPSMSVGVNKSIPAEHCSSSLLIGSHTGHSGITVTCSLNVHFPSNTSVQTVFSTSHTPIPSLFGQSSVQANPPVFQPRQYMPLSKPLAFGNAPVSQFTGGSLFTQASAMLVQSSPQPVYNLGHLQQSPGAAINFPYQFGKPPPRCGASNNLQGTSTPFLFDNQPVSKPAPFQFVPVTTTTFASVPMLSNTTTPLTHAFNFNIQTTSRNDRKPIVSVVSTAFQPSTAELSSYTYPKLGNSDASSNDQIVVSSAAGQSSTVATGLHPLTAPTTRTSFPLLSSLLSSSSLDQTHSTTSSLQSASNTQFSLRMSSSLVQPLPAATYHLKDYVEDSVGETQAEEDGHGDQSHSSAADLDFTPLVSLPLVEELRSGEEDEEVLFSHRAKLYRFDTMQWKERGIGEMKILRHKDTGKTRLLMRRDQVLKVCCNHYITVDMSLTPVSGHTYLWAWFTQCDFTDGVPNAEKLAIKFKHQKTAETFKEVFERCVAQLSSCDCADSIDHTSSHDASTESLKEHLSTPDGWSCDACYVQNAPLATKCVACGNSHIQNRPEQSNDLLEEEQDVANGLELKGGGSAVSTITQKVTPSAFPVGGFKISSLQFLSFPTSTAQSSTPTTSAGGMKLEGLRLDHSETSTNFQPISLGSLKPFRLPSDLTPDVVNQQSANVAESREPDVYIKPVVTHSESLKEVLDTSDGWSCDTCYVQNGPSATKCVACGNSHELEGPGRSNDLRKEVALEQDAANIIKGGGSAVSTLTQKVTPSAFPVGGLKIGSLQFLGFPTSTAQSSTPTSSAGGMKLEGLRLDHSETSTNFQPISLGSLKPFRLPSDFTPDAVNQTCTEQRNEEKSVVESYEPDVYFKPVVTLSESVELRTGEEDEDVLFCNRAKLFRFDSKLQQWKERGIGEMKILKNHSSRKARLLMRREQVLKICCNHYIVPQMTLSPLTNSDRSWVWYTVSDLSDEEAKPEKLAIRFKLPETAEHFKRVFDECAHEEVIESMFEHSNSESPCNVAQIQDEDEVIVVGDELPSEEKVLLAKSLMLPPTFFNYEQKPPCPGCRGCADSDSPVKEQVQPESSKDEALSEVLSQSPGHASIFPIAVVSTTQSKIATSKSDFSSMPSLSFTDTAPSSNNNDELSSGHVPLIPAAVVSTPQSETVSTKFQFGSISSVPTLSFADIACSSPIQFGSTKSSGFANAGQLLFTSQPATDEREQCSPEDEADVTFKPIVSLKKMQMKTGEENESILFCRRAKLYRFDGSVWKERGVGDIKILENSKNHKSRILMRRDQILKVCCNHFITASMTLLPSQGSDKSWMWYTACDFADEESKEEKFAVRFKHSESAELFKSVFDSCVFKCHDSSQGESVSVPSDCDTHLLTETDPSSDFWTCDSCYVQNADCQNSCVACGADKYSQVGPEVTSESSSAENAPDIAGLLTVKVCSPTTFSHGSESLKPALPLNFPQHHESSDHTSEGQSMLSCMAYHPSLVQSRECTLHNETELLESVGEDEEEVFSCGGKLSYHNVETRQWVTKGTGCMKIIKNKSSQQQRVLMIGDDVNSTVLCAHSISTLMRLRSVSGNDSSWVWNGYLFGSMHSMVQQYRIDFSSTVEAEEFKRKFQPTQTIDIKERDILTSSKEALKEGKFDAFSATIPTTPYCKDDSNEITQENEEDVVFLYEELPAPDLVQRAEDLLLPQSFYLYLHKAPCPGCRGCVSDDDGSVTSDKDYNQTMYHDATIPSQADVSEHTVGSDSKSHSPAGSSEQHSTSNADNTKDRAQSASPSHVKERKTDVATITASRSKTSFSSHGLLSFADLTKGSGFSSSFGKTVGFKFDGAGAQLFASQESCVEDIVDPEAEADVSFQPVVSLPESVNFQSWDDEADSLFSHRAKLFRFDTLTNQWKERGVGDMKIMRHKTTHKARLIMRREQILKICCNHYITEGMELIPGTSEKSWVWFTPSDMTDEEPKPEKLAIRFKHAESAKEFQKVFYECVSQTSQFQSTDSNISFGTDSTLPSESWECKECLVVNNKDASHCVACETPKDNMTKIEDCIPSLTDAEGLSPQKCIDI